MAMTVTALFLAAMVANTVAPAAAASEASLREVDQRQSVIVQAGDLQALEQLMHPDYVVHVPNGRTLDRAQVLEIARTGVLTKEKHRRVQEQTKIVGTTGIVMGVDHLETPPALAQRGELKRRYTNIYVFEDGRWKHFARHFHFLP